MGNFLVSSTLESLIIIDKCFIRLNTEFDPLQQKCFLLKIERGIEQRSIRYFPEWQGISVKVKIYVGPALKLKSD